MASTSSDIDITEKVRIESLFFYYGDVPALKDISMIIRDRQITALIGPSGCG
jgi:phosphate transport system ATP-binding protein